jgi:hypothetical protein
MVPHRCGGVDQAAIIRAEERRERDKHWRMKKHNGDSMTVRITEAVRVSMVGIDSGLSSSSSSSNTSINLHIPRRRSSIIIVVGNLDASTHKEECR